VIAAVMEEAIIVFAKWTALVWKVTGAALIPLGALLQETGGEAAAGKPVDVWGTPVWGIPSVVWHALNLIILVVIIGWGAKAVIRAGMKSRREGLMKGITDAAALRDEMRAKFNEYDQRMRTIDQRITTIVSDARAEAEVEKAKLIADATQLATRLREDAKQIADQEIARAKRELQDEQIARAAELAETILEKTVNKDDQQRIAGEFLGKIDGEKGRKERPA